MAEDKEPTETQAAIGPSRSIEDARKVDGTDPAQPAVEDGKDLFDLGLDTRNSFRMLRKSVRHFIAHEEYGVLFSFCGMRITKNQVEYNPAEKPNDVRCEKCKQHIWQIIATQKYAERLKEKKDLID